MEPHSGNILQDLIIILLAVVVIIPLFRFLRIPTLVGFLITGVVIGPHGLALIKEVENVSTLAEVGVILLLFTIGLEFPLNRFKQLKKFFLVGGMLQVILTSVVVGSILDMLGMEFRQALFFGLLVSLSSTAIVTKLLADRHETNSPHGKVSIGILLFQDVAFVPIMLLIPILAATGDGSFIDVLQQSAVAFGVVVVLIVVGRYVMPLLMRSLVKLRSREMFVLGTVLVSLGTAWLTSLAGLSFALGAFIAGLVLAESDYSHQIFAEIIPLRDTLGSLFFISIGMLLDVRLALNSPFFLGGESLSVLAVKVIIMVGVVLILRYPVRIGVLSALALAQVGEFSFILSRTGHEAGLLTAGYYQDFLAITVITMIAAPFLIQYGSPVVERFLRRFPNLMSDEQTPEGHTSIVPAKGGHVVIIGYGVNGRNLALVLKETGIPYVIVELDADVVRETRNAGEPIIYGDGTRAPLLSQVNIEKARVLVIAFSDPESTRQIVRTARSMNSGLHIIVRTHYLSEMEELYRLGANQVIPEEFETSIEIFTRVLREFHVPRNVIDAQIEVLRTSNYSMMRGLKIPDAMMDQMQTILAAGTTDTFLVLPDSSTCGKTLGELALRSRTGATAIAVVRKDKPITNPRADFLIEAGDILVLLGTHAEVDAAFDVLSTKAGTGK